MSFSNRIQEVLKMTEDELWEECSFVETVDPNDKDKMRTFHD